MGTREVVKTALTRSLGTIRVSLDELRAILALVTDVVPPDARVRLIRIAGVRQANKPLELASVDDLTALPGLPDVLYDLSVSVVATAERPPAGGIEYRVQLVSDAKGLGLQVFSDDVVWAHGALHVLGRSLADFEAAEPKPARSNIFMRMWKPFVAGALAGAAVATAYYHDLRAGGVLAVVGAVLWYLIDLTFAVATPQRETRDVPNLQVVVRDVATFAPQRPRLDLLPAIKAIVAVAAIAAVAVAMVRFFPHQSPPAAQRASAHQVRHR